MRLTTSAVHWGGSKGYLNCTKPSSESTLQGHLPADFKADATGPTANKNDLIRKIFHVASL